MRHADSVNEVRLSIKLHSKRAQRSDLAAGTEHLQIV
jgi:twitching motility protein PilU